MSGFCLGITGLYLLFNIHSSFTIPLFTSKRVPVWRINYMAILSMIQEWRENSVCLFHRFVYGILASAESEQLMCHSPTQWAEFKWHVWLSILSRRRPSLTYRLTLTQGHYQIGWLVRDFERIKLMY